MMREDRPHTEHPEHPESQQPAGIEDQASKDRILDLSLERIKELKTIMAAVYNSHLYRDKADDGTNQWQQLWTELVKRKRNSTENLSDDRKATLSREHKQYFRRSMRGNLFNKMRTCFMGALKYGPRGSEQANQRYDVLVTGLLEKQAAENQPRIDEIRNTELTTDWSIRDFERNSENDPRRTEPTGVTIGKVWDAFNIPELGGVLYIEDLADRTKDILLYLINAYKAKQKNRKQIENNAGWYDLETASPFLPTDEE